MPTRTYHSQPQPLDQVKTSVMELNMAMVKAKKHKESREHKMVEDFNTDRDVFKGHSTSFMFEEFAKVFDTTFESREDEEFDRLIDNPSTTGMTLSLTRSTGILPGNSSPMSSGRTRERDSSRKRSSRR